MPYTMPLVPRSEGAPYTFFENLLSSDECDRIIEVAKVMPPEPAFIGGAAGAGVIDPKRRSSEVRWLNWSADHEWLFGKLAINIATTNAKWFGFRLTGMNEPLQLTHYKSKELQEGEAAEPGHYTWHEDHSEVGAFTLRKLSFVIPLNDGFEGGRFRLIHEDIPQQGKGNMIVFPSYKTHCVEPVTKGERWSLVGWVTGPPFM